MAEQVNSNPSQVVPGANPAGSSSGEQQSGGTPQQSSPQLIDGKWKDTQDVVKSYNELKSAFDKLQSTKSTPNASASAPEAPKSEPQQAQSQPSESLIRSAAKEFNEAGDLSSGTLDRIAKALGTDTEGAKVIANTFKADLQSRQAALSKQVSEAGVKLTPVEIMKEASKYYSKEDLEIIGKATDRGMYDLFVGMAKNIQGKMGPNLPAAERGEIGGGNSAAGFKDFKEMSKALGDKRMSTDGEYWKQQMSRLNATPPEIQDQYRTGGLK